MYLSWKHVFQFFNISEGFLFVFFTDIANNFQTVGGHAKGQKLTIIVINNIRSCYNETFYNNIWLILSTHEMFHVL